MPLPPGWEETPVGEFCEVTMGQSPPGSTYNDRGIGLPFYQGKAEFGDLYPAPVKWCSAPTKLADADDVLISVRAPVGPTNLSPAKSCIGRGLAAIRPLEGIASRYVLYALRNREPQVAQMGTGSTFKAISGDVLRRLPLPLAPFQEQRHIVAAIEEHLSRLDSAVAGLRRVQALIPRYRAAVLKAAVEGRLVPRRGAWQTVPVGELALKIEYGTSARAALEGDIPVLRMGNIVDGRLDLESLKFLPKNHHEFPRLLLEPGDVLFNRTNSAELVGKTAVYHGTPAPCSVASYLIRVRLNSSCLPDYLATFLNSVHGRGWVAEVASQQVGQANVSGAKLKALRVPTPPVEEQKQIVSEVERRMSLVEAVRHEVEAGLGRAARLRQSILKCAFEGKLVPQDPTDEPASVLLGRIRASRARAPSPPKRSRRRA